MKFDVVIGNPPYQSDKSLSDNGTRSKQLYKDFLLNSLKLSDNVVMVIPALWTHKPCVIKTELINFGLKTVAECTKEFNVDIAISYIIAEKGYTGLTEIINIQEENYHQLLSKDTPIHLNSSMRTVDIFQKLDTSTNLSELWYRSDMNRNDTSIGTGSTNVIEIIDAKSKECKIVQTSKPSSEFPLFNNWKVIVNNVAGSMPKNITIGDVSVAEPNIGTSYSVVALFANTEQEANNLANYLKSTLVSFIIKNVKNNIANSKILFSNIPAIDLSKSWTDAELYQHFKLTQEEIDYIEQSVK